MALQRLIAQGTADANGDIDGLTDPSWVPTVQQVFTGSLSIPGSTITAQWTLFVNSQEMVTFIGQSVVNGVQVHLMDRLTLSATGLTPSQTVQAVFAVEQTPENRTQVSVPSVQPTGTTQNAGNIQFLAGAGLPVPASYGLILDLTQIIYPANTVLANYNTAVVTVTNTSGSPQTVVIFGNNAPVGINTIAQGVIIPNNGTYQYAIPIVGVTRIFGSGGAAGVEAFIVLTEETMTNPAVLGWDEADDYLTPLPLSSAGGGIPIGPVPLPVLTVASGSPTYGQTSVGSTATTIAAPRTDRSGLSIHVLSTALQPVFVGTDASVTTSNGLELEPGMSVTFATPVQIYGIVAAGSVTVSWEDE